MPKPAVAVPIGWPRQPPLLEYFMAVGPATTGMYLPSFPAALRIAEGQVWVLEDGGALTGVLVLDDAEGNALLLDNVAVVSTAQGKGHRRALNRFRWGWNRDFRLERRASV